MAGGIEHLAQTVERFSAFMRRRPEVPNQTGTGAEWDAVQVLAHLVYHHEAYVAQAEAVANGAPFRPPAGRWREINALAVESLAAVPVPDLLDRLRAANDRLSEIYRQCDPNSISLELKRGVRMRSLAELVPEVEAHIRNHLLRLEAAERARLSSAGASKVRDR